MNVNFTGSCVALPDIEQRLERDLYDSDKDAWLSEGLTKEDVEILRQRAADLDKEGYQSMTPYLRCADLSGCGARISCCGYGASALETALSTRGYKKAARAPYCKTL